MRASAIALLLASASSQVALSTGDPGTCADTGTSRVSLSLEPPAPGTCAAEKKVHLVRHAQGTHNYGERRAEERKEYRDNSRHAELYEKHGRAYHLLWEVTGDKYVDAQLTTAGRLQASKLEFELRSADVSLDAVYSSPTRRALQTAFIAVPALKRGSRTRSPPAIATDLLRERVANYTSDARLRASQLAALFPAVDFGLVSEEDELYQSNKEDGPDGAAKLRARALRAAEWLVGRPASEREVAVFSHQHLLQAFFQSLGALDLAQQTFANAERRVIYLCAPAAGPRPEAAGAV